jgi:drug/metabolite transporter (DMT)-like permease
LTRNSALLVILGSALWATDALFRRPLTGQISPITIVLLEHCVLAAVTFPVVWRRRAELLRLRAHDFASLLFIALGGSVAATVLFTVAVKYGNPSVAIVLQKSQPIFTVLLARLALGERPAKWFWPCFVTATGGALLMGLPDPGNGSSWVSGHATVSLCAVAAAALWGSATVCGRHLVAEISTAFLTSLRFLLALPALAVLFWLQPPAQRGLPASASSMASVVAMALIPGLLSLLIYYRGLRSTPASIASICELAFPVTAVVVNWLILDVRLTTNQLSGSAILVASVTALAWVHTSEQARSRAGGSKIIRA